MNEHSFSAKILKKCREQGIEKAWKINDNFAGGVPDAWFLGNKNDLWVEFKWLKALPKRESTIIKPALTAQQLSWIKMLTRCGKQGIVVIGYPKHALLLQEQDQWVTGISSATAELYHALTHQQIVEFIISATTKPV